MEDIKFEKPNCKILKLQGFTAVDMHLHSRYSDCFTKVSKILKKANKLGIGVAISDHNEIKGSLIAQKQNDVMVIPATEITTKEGAHVLFYFYDKNSMVSFFEKEVKNYRGKNPYMAVSKTAEELIYSGEKYNAVIAPAHPMAKPTRYSFGDKVISEEINSKVLKKIDAIEVLCGQNLRKMNTRAIEWNKELGKGMTAGSDGHVLACLGSVATYAEASTVEEFLDAVCSKKTFVSGKEMGIPTRIYPYSTMATKHGRFLGPVVGEKLNGSKLGEGIKNKKAAIGEKISSLNDKRKQKIEAFRLYMERFKKKDI